ncbi:hypothetical protein J0S82_007124 [Galemys pyrenaicus]|uniref:Uncharacterized protein n=1 Tax=Galemys pyrenaicus TaxID=202257 RepID=A0A8J6A9L7_GALPY|nr:hypothetical protein J0S82_007124 [Galemys pyrenaicus]
MPPAGLLALWLCYAFLAYLGLYYLSTFLRSLLTSGRGGPKATVRVRRKRRRRGRARLSLRLSRRRAR